MRKRYILCDKKRGETPLAAIQAWKSKNPEYADVSASYAGRLDPMASGKLLVLLGDECKKQKKYQGLDKEYVIEVVLDMETDTGDALGMSQYAGVVTKPGTELRSVLPRLSGSHTVPYPAFSSKTVNGKPLFLYTLEGTLDAITIPTHTETIYGIHLVHTEQVSGAELHKRIAAAIADVPRSTEPSKALGADFRQDAIRTEWDTLFSEIPERHFTILTLRVTCASGSYMRTLAGSIARELGTTGFALSIDRTRIGTYRKVGPLGFWSKQY